ncbi:MAG: fimbria/pilus outer membrane usher protein [Sphingomonas adhaesiva]|uniref:fimbria/pilus outer membrane usher protein n=1 Tax=Sphingomonas adhaesiva TaxID=28212 RepID=UPI002FF818FB
MRRFLLWWAALALLLPGAARADSAVPPATFMPAVATLFVELVVNGQSGGPAVEMQQEGDRLLLAPDVLRRAGLSVPGAAPVDVAHHPSLRVRYDASALRLSIDAPASLLPVRRIAAEHDARVTPVVDTGALLNYDLYAQRIDRRTTVSLWSEQRVFGRFGTASNTGVWARRGYVRLDTRYAWVDEGRALDATAGDLISRALPWTSAVRMGGVQLSRNFAIRPDLVTVPLPSFAGEAAVPSAVDLFINGYRQARSEVAPGRFVLDSVPVVNGAGEARVVTTDAVGRQMATVIPFYVAPELLRPGLTDFSVEAGALRHRYGAAGFDYGRAVASASLRHGVDRTLTLSAHVEGTRGLVAAGAGVAWAPGRWGALSGSVLASRTAGATGTQVTAGYGYVARNVTVGVEHVARSSGFGDIAGFDLGGYAGSRRSDRVTLSVPAPGNASLGAALIAARARDGARLRLASLSWSMPVGRGASLFAAVDHDLARRFSAQLRLVVPLGTRALASAGVARDASGGTRIQLGTAQAMPSDGGLGYAADLARAPDGSVLGQGSATWRGRAVQLDAGIAGNGRATSIWGGVAGSVTWLDGRAYAANSLPGAFAVVATDMADVPVYYENQQMGRTGRDGRMFVPAVTAWHPGSFAIDPVRLPADAIARATQARATLRGGTGAVIRLPVVYRRSVTARLVDAQDAPLPPGTPATLDGATEAVVGWDGVLLIEGLRGAVTVAATLADGRPCHATAQVPETPGVLPDVGTIVCR